MLGFIIPFKSQRSTSDWEKDNLLLKNTVDSLLNQSSPDYIIYVVYTDAPLYLQQSGKIRLLQSPFPYLSYHEMSLPPDVIDFHKSETMVEKRLDKGKKITYGSKIAKEDGCSYLMAVDADDLVSDKVAAFVAANASQQKEAGWYIPEGYVFNRNTNTLLKHHSLHFFNGSTHIIKAAYVPVPSFDTAGFHDYSFFTAHGWLIYRVKELYGKALEPLPFPAVIYVVHDNNISNVNEVVFGKTIRNQLKKIIFRKKIKSSVIKEFSIPKA
ncbi:MAG: hypothetical protein QM687_10895 [Ferruginibacter sp.]